MFLMCIINKLIEYSSISNLQKIIFSIMKEFNFSCTVTYFEMVYSLICSYGGVYEQMLYLKSCLVMTYYFKFNLPSILLRLIASAFIKPPQTQNKLCSFHNGKTVKGSRGSDQIKPTTPQTISGCTGSLNGFLQWPCPCYQA